MAKLSIHFRATLRLFAFYLANGSLSNFCPDVLSDDFDFAEVFSEPSFLEGVFAVFGNTIELDGDGTVMNEGLVLRRVAQYIRHWVDAGYTVDPPFEPWETELHL